MKKLRKCPKCRRLPIIYLEMWAGHSIEFAAVDGVPEKEGNLEAGSPTHVIAECGCGHMWRLRGVLQITDVVDTTEILGEESEIADL